MVCIDAHAHLALRAGALEHLLHAMDDHQLDRAFVVGGGLMDPGALSRRMRGGAPAALDVSFDNPELLTRCRAHRDRLVPFYFANPWQGPREYQEVGGAFYGLKLAPAVHGVPIDHPLHDRLYAAAEALGHPVYLHCLAHAGFQVEDLAQVARRRPDVTFILGHAGVGNLDFTAVDLIAGIPNVVFETSGGFAAVIVHAVKVLGSGRVLFGTEYPLQDPAAELVKIDRLPVARSDLARIKGDNAVRLVAGVRHVD